MPSLAEEIVAILDPEALDDFRSWKQETVVRVQPKKGMRFHHSRVLDTAKWDGKSPQLFEVTKVASGTAYYRAVYDLGTRETKGAPACCPVEQFGRWCGSVA